MSLIASAPLPASTHWGGPNGITTFAPAINRVWTVTYIFAIPIGLIVIGLIIWAVVRWHRRGVDDNRRPRQFQYHIPLEAAYTIIPLVVVGVLFGFMYGVENKIIHVSPHPDVKINVQGFQWGWKFTYPNGHEEIGSVAAEPNIEDTKDLPILRMPEHETVQFTLQSDDVNHSFYVPEFLFKRDLIQGVHNVVDVNVVKTGDYIGECTQLCGTYHAFMRFRLLVMTQSAYNGWYHSTKPNSITCAGGGNC